MKIAGLDLSKNSPGCVKLTLDDWTLDITNVEFCGFTSVKKNESKGINFFKKDDFNFDQDQFLKLENIIFDFLEDVSHIALEDYAYGGSGNITDLAEFCGFVKLKQYSDNKKIRVYDIPSIKMFATTFGNSDKLSMYQAFLKENEMKPDISKMPVVAKGNGVSPTSDIVDAYWISRFLQLELKLRKGLVQLKDLDETKIKLFNRVTKAQPQNLLATDFIEKR
jgi:hypothetical protein